MQDQFRNSRDFSINLDNNFFKQICTVHLSHFIKLFKGCPGQ